MMSGSKEKSLEGAIKYGAVFAEVGRPTLYETSKKLTHDRTQLQGLSSVLPRSRLRFVFASTGISEAEVTLHCVALEGTKQV